MKEKRKEWKKRRKLDYFRITSKKNKKEENERNQIYKGLEWTGNEQTSHTIYDLIVFVISIGRYICHWMSHEQQYI